MSERLRRGVWMFPAAPARDIVEAIVLAEELGLDEFWIGDEGPARDPFGILAAAAISTNRIRLGIAVTNPYLRHPVTIAVEAMTVHELSGGRMTLGLGPGGRIALDPAGVDRVRPLAAVRQALRTIRAVSRGEAAQGYRPPTHPFTRPDLPVYIGSRSRNFQRLGSAEADGVFLGGLAEPVIGPTVGWARSVRPVEIALYNTAVFDPAEREFIRPNMILALADSPDHALASLGLEREAVTAAAVQYAAGNPDDAEKLVTPAVFDALVLHGDPRRIGQQLADRVRNHRPDSIGLTFTSNDPQAVVRASVEAFGYLEKELG